MNRPVLTAVAALAALPVAAMAQWSDNFDSYAVGTIQGQGGWKGWDNVPAAAGLVTNNFFQSAPNSQQINGAADSVHEYAGYTSGWWSYSGNVYIPSGVTTGASYFILMNDYADGAQATGDWSTEIKFNLAGNVAFDDLAGTGGGPSPGSNSVPLVRNAWVPFRVDIDLTGNTQSIYYNNALIMSTSWTRGQAAAQLSIEAVDLYAANSGAIYYDNLAITQIPGPASAALLGLAGLMAGRRRR
jgi:hypothetical protein